MRSLALAIAAAALALAGCKSDSQKCLASTLDDVIPVCQRACDGNDAKACDHLGYVNMLYRHDVAAKAAYQKACDLGNADSCAWVKK